jgi:RecA/RadA recombinase
MDTSELRKQLMAKTKTKTAIKPSDYLSTGSTLLDLSCSGTHLGGLCKGKYFFLVGDSSSGKTFLSLTCFAEAARNPSFKGYRLIHDNAEDGALMDIKKFFGNKVADRIEPPAYLDDGSSYYSSTIEEFYYHVDDAVDEGRPFIYVLDSMDALTSSYEVDRFEMRKKAHREQKEAKGDYGDGKAKINSSHLRALLPKLRDTGSILIIINQTRDNLGMSFAEKTRSGGRALKFYATLEMWSAVAGRLKKKVRGIDRQVGIQCQIKIKKNRLIGLESTITVPIFHSYGIDNIGSCIDYLVKEKHWQKNGQKIKTKEFDEVLTRDGLIQMIEEEDMEADLREIVSDVWHDILKRTALQRKPRYE